jgi:altronate hydrolase
LRGEAISLRDDIPAGHRFALKDIPEGVHVVQYGHAFGVSTGIEKGEVITGKNAVQYFEDYEALGSKIPERMDFVFPVKEKYLSRTFSGFLRGDGGIGTRNYYLIVPASMCASDVAVKLAVSLEDGGAVRKLYPNIDGVIAAAHTEGCGCDDGRMIDRYMLTLKNTVAHPNVGGALVIDLGCEKKTVAGFSEFFGDISGLKPIDYLSIQAEGGTGRALKKGREIVVSRLGEVNTAEREDLPLSGLVLGTECGASDTFSGITANPVIGMAVDMVIATGGSAILSEVPEMLGAEASLVGRMCSLDIVEKFRSGIDDYKRLSECLGVDMEGNFVEGNARGGLVNLALKSLGAVLKGGRSEIVDFLDYSERVTRKGLSVMNGPGNDLESMTGMVASGANLILFSTGLGTTEGNLLVPVIKIPTRTEVFERMNEDMDFDAGRLLDEDVTVERLAEDLVDLVVEVASGKKTWSEKWGKRSFQIWTAGKLSL